MDIKLIKIGGKSLLKEGEVVSKGVHRVASVIASMSKETDKLICVLSAIGDDTNGYVTQSKGITADPDPVMYDFLVSLGEQKSIALVGMALIDKGIKTLPLTGWQAGILTTDVHTKASVISVDVTKIVGYLNEYDVILVAGFQGVTVDNMVTTLGRGGSDTTAVSIATKMGLEDCIFLKDVRGVYTGDPKKIHEAHLINAVSHDMLMEVASSGAEIINIRAAELAKTYSQKLSIRHIDEYSKKGTEICTSTSITSFSVITSTKVAMLSVLGIDNLPGKISPVLSVFEENLIKVSYIDQVVSENGLANIIYLIHEGTQDKLQRLRFLVNNVTGAEKVIVEEDVALISLVSDHFLDGVGIVLDVMKSLQERGVEVLGIGTSEIKVAFTVRRDMEIIAAEIVHDLMGRIQNENS